MDADGASDEVTVETQRSDVENTNKRVAPKKLGTGKGHHNLVKQLQRGDMEIEKIHHLRWCLRIHT